MPKSEEKPFVAKAEKVENGIKITFNKESLNNESLLKDIVLKDSKANIVPVKTISTQTDNKSILLEVENANSDYYTIYMPKRFLSKDGYALSNEVVSTPHFEVTKSGFNENIEEGKISFKTAYKNSKNVDTNIIAVIAAYDKTTGILKAVDTKTYTIDKSVDGTENVFEPDELPTIVKGSDTIVKGFIWEAATYAPKYVVTPTE